MLLRSPRHTPDDLTWWDHHAVPLDEANSRSPRLQSHETAAMLHLEAWAERHGGITVATSWGKDSVTVADLALRVDPTTRLWHASAAGKPGRSENPDTAQVADVFHARWGVTATVYTPADCGYADDQLEWINRHHEPVNVTGVRSAESSDRAMSAAVHGVTTGRFCRPILRWPTSMVFAYLHHYRLPVHAAYAMTCGGTLDRERLRVHSIGGPGGRGHGRREWEARYYGPELAAAENG